MKLPGCVIYDNGGKSADRYTIVNPTPFFDRVEPRIPYFWYGAASSDPYWPQGIGLTMETRMHRVDKPSSQHLGRKVRDHSKLPEQVRRFACQVCDTAEQLELFQ